MNDTDFRQFHGAFDSAMEPDSAFAERMRRRMAAEAPAKPVPVQPIIGASPSGRSVNATAPDRRHPLFIAAAALVVFALALASVVQLAPRVLEPQYASQAVATLPADASATPGPDVTLTAEMLPGVGTAGQVHMYEDHLIAVTSMSGSDQPYLVSYDPASGAVQWQQEVPEMWHILFGDDVIIGITYSEPKDNDPNSLFGLEEMAAYNIDTGEELWTNSLAEWDVVHGWETVMMAGDTAVIVLGGKLVAIDGSSGEMRWQAGYDLYASREDNYVQPPALMHIGEELYLGQVDGSIEVLNLTTGASVRQFTMPASFQQAHPVSMQMFSVPAGLLVAADTYVGSGALTTLVVVNPADGSVVWERALDQSSRINVASDGSIAMATYTWNSAPFLLRLLGQHGHTASALVWLDANGWVMLETDPVRQPEMSPLAVASNSDYACVTLKEFTCFDRAGTRYLPAASNVWNAWFEGNMLYLVTDTGVYRVDLP